MNNDHDQPAPSTLPNPIDQTGPNVLAAIEPPNSTLHIPSSLSIAPFSLLEPIQALLLLLITSLHLHDTLTLLLLFRVFAQNHIVISGIPLVLFTTLISVLVHLFQLVPRAKSRWDGGDGYLHGGLLIDFVGQRGWDGSDWTWRAWMVGLDLVVLAGQTLWLTLEERRVRELKGVRRRHDDSDRNRAQDLRAEEEGRRRSEEAGIEMQELTPLGVIDDNTSGVQRNSSNVSDASQQDVILTLRDFKDIFVRGARTSGREARRAAMNTMLGRLVNTNT